MRVLRNTPAVFFTAMILSLIFPSFAVFTRDLVIPTLAAVMTLSLEGLKLKGFDFRKSILNLALNYGFLGGLIILLSSAMPEDYRLGFIVMAAAPPAIAIVPFSKLLGGDVSEASLSNGLIYLVSLFLTPAIILYFTGRVVDVFEILKALLILILIPLIVSRFFRIKDSTPWINLGFALVIYTVIGLNANILYKNFLPLVKVVLVGVIRTFGTGSLILLAFMKKDFSTAITKALFSSYKNLGFTAGVSLYVFGEKASIPAAICIFLEILLFNYYYFLRKRLISS
jgi:BASS family bile acid:Na+ symporter